jgi:hypothetical protein
MNLHDRIHASDPPTAEELDEAIFAQEAALPERARDETEELPQSDAPTEQERTGRALRQQPARTRR